MAFRFAFIIWALATSALCSAATFVVTSAADTGGSVCGGNCTLRQAITAANATAAADTINFAILLPIRGEILISPATSLPSITQPLTINGYSQSGTQPNDDPIVSNAILRIRIDGAATSSADGLNVCAPNVTIRGLAITRFEFRGILASSACGASATQIHGNFIGLTTAGLAPAGTQMNTGIVISGTGSIGSAAPADRNVIGNGATGINVSNSNVSVLGNLLGRNPADTAARTLTTGITFLSTGLTGATVGSLAAPNRIRSSTVGIRLAAGIGIDFAANVVFTSAALGIDLGSDGVTPNDTNDTDVGPNDLQNFPLITSAQRVLGGISLSGTLDVGHPGTLAYKLTTYANSSCHSSGHGEGERILGQTTRNFSSVAQDFTYTQTTSDPLPPGTVITMTATRAGVGTSEFSACFVLDPAPLVVNSSNDVADGVCNATHCSLRDAIILANASTSSGFQRIHFAIPPLNSSSEILIAPTSSLPTLTSTVAIDGYTQPGSTPNNFPEGSNAVLRIRLDGLNAGTDTNGLSICNSNSIIRGLSLTRFRIGVAVGITSSSATCPTLPADVAIQGNWIGLSPAGSPAGALIGIRARGEVLIGSTDLADRNIIANSNTGLLFVQDTEGSQVLGNLIGTDPSGQLPMANVSGITVNTGSPENLLIGSVAAPNFIRFNGEGVSISSGTGAAMGPNNFGQGDGLAVDLSPDGVTPNDIGDGDAGANNLQNFPVLTLAERTDSGVRIAGTLDSGSNATIAFYASRNCHVSGHGPGEVFLGTLFSTAPTSFERQVISDVDFSVFDTITATATRLGSTSEMSACIAVTDPPPGIAVDTQTDSTTLDGGCDVTGDANTCTLREAITLANTQVGNDAIRFAIPGDGPHVITLAADLPIITGGLFIDGYTEQGAVPNADPIASDAVLKIDLRGTGMMLTVCSRETVELRGLALSGGSVATGDASCLGLLHLRGNWFGFSATGASLSFGSIVARQALAMGGSAPALRNVIGNSTTRGLRIDGVSAGASVAGNIFGRSPDLTQFAPNAIAVEINESDVIVGGDGDAINQFYGNGLAILVGGANADFNRLEANHFATSGAATAIDLSDSLSANGINPNDVNDDDIGANEGQNSPVLADGSAGPSSITINGILDVPGGIAAPVDYRLAFYRSAGCNDASGTGNGRRGEVYLGAVEQPFLSNAENFSITLNVPPESGFITATATSPNGSTSEFSNCLVAPRPNGVFANGFE